MWFCFLLADLPFRRSWHCLDEFVPVPDLEQGVEDVDVDEVAASVRAATEDLVRDRDDAVDRDDAAHPVVPTAVVEGLEVECRHGNVVVAIVEALGRGGHLETLVGTLGVVVVDPSVEFSLGDVQ